LEIDVQRGQQQEPPVRAALENKLHPIIGGPNCRSRSVEGRYEMPGNPNCPRPIRAWGGHEYGIEGLTCCFSLGQPAAEALMLQVLERSPKLCPLSWNEHIARGHVPYRRDCAVCQQQTIHQGHPHRKGRFPAGGVLSLDLAGPLVPAKGRPESAFNACWLTAWSISLILHQKIDREKPGCKGATFGNVNKKPYSFFFLL